MDVPRVNDTQKFAPEGATHSYGRTYYRIIWRLNVHARMPLVSYWNRKLGEWCRTYGYPNFNELVKL